jgi:hypothetical protein
MHFSNVTMYISLNNYSVKTITSLLLQEITRRGPSETNKLEKSDSEYIATSSTFFGRMFVGMVCNMVTCAEAVYRPCVSSLRASGSLSCVSHDRLMNAPHVVIVNLHSI